MGCRNSVNLKSVFNFTKLLTIMWKQASGRVINMSSVVGVSESNKCNYSASKPVYRFTKSAAKEIGIKRYSSNA